MSGPAHARGIAPASVRVALDRRTERRRRTAALASVVALTVLLAIGLAAPATLLAASCAGASHQASLVDGRTTPGSGTTQTGFTFIVRYVDNAGCTPTVTLVVDGLATVPMTAGATAPDGSVAYAVSRSLPVGSWAYRFEAISGTGPGRIVATLDVVSPATIIVAAAAPPPPGPTPAPNPKPVPTDPPAPTDSPAPPTPPAPPDPTDLPTSTEPASGSGEASPSGPVGGSDVATTPRGGTRPATPPVGSDRWLSARESPDPAAPGGAGTGGPHGGSGASDPSSGGNDPGGGGVNGSILSAIWSDDVVIPIVSWFLSTVGGLVMFAIAMRRRSGEGRDLRFATAMVFSPGVSQPSAVGAALAAAPLDVEADIPRWRRPSLEAARRSRPPSDIVREPIRFADEPHNEADRRVVGYRLVRVGDSPDDLRSAELGRLDRGDEVEVLDTAGDWTHIRSADGLDGWVPSITILTRIIGPAAPATDPAAGSKPGRGRVRRLLGRQSGR
ncbi:MAG: SH3 domain-containing protein [Chloroflexota bacterium]